jgi:hypothetical protein
MTIHRPLRSTDPRRLGRYALSARLGEGGQGVVYLAEAPDGRYVAIKLLHASPVDDERGRRRFDLELRATQKIHPSCTAQVIDAEIDGDVCYIVSEYIEGSSLSEVVKEQGPLSGGSLERLAIGMATALAAIHRAAVVHRDFKPTNVLLGPDGPRVIDFGIARLLDTVGCSTSQLLGTPAYMAPEQIHGSRVGPASDVFAWGCTVAYAANGRPPFGGDYIPAIINRILHAEPDLGILESPLRDLVAACLHKRPDQRPTAQQLLLVLQNNDVIEPDSVVPSTVPDGQRTRIDITKPNIARVYEAFLGGKDNFAVDREMAQRAAKLFPPDWETARGALDNRAFLKRVVRYLVDKAGVRQFIDFGSGLPTQGNVHEVAQEIDPLTKVVYVDNDPVVITHARALLGYTDTTAIVAADLRRPEEIVDNPAVRGFIDFSQPIGLLLLAILHHINDDEEPADIAARLRRMMPPGSYMAISHFHNPGSDRPEDAARAEMCEKIFYEELGTGRWRSREEILAYFGDLEPIEPGLVPVPAWRPEPGDSITEHPTYHLLIGGVARKP